MSYSGKLIKPKEGVVGTSDLTVSLPEAQVTTWTFDGHLKCRTALWDWALNLMLSLGRQCQSWVELCDTQVVSENCLVVWKEPHTLESVSEYCCDLCDSGAASLWKGTWFFQVPLHLKHWLIRLCPVKGMFEAVVFELFEQDPSKKNSLYCYPFPTHTRHKSHEINLTFTVYSVFDISYCLFHYENANTHYIDFANHWCIKTCNWKIILA